MRPSPPFFVISDTHFGHDLIIKHCQRPYDFESMIIKRWRTKVKPSDAILFLGDLFLGGDAYYQHFAETIAPRLTGHKFMVRGNHDRKRYDYEALGFQVLKPFQMDYQGFNVTFDHYPRHLNMDPKRIHVHGHIHNHGYGPDGDEYRFGNVNVSCEMVDYTPQRVTRVLNREIAKRRGRGASRGFYNSPSYRQATTSRKRRATNALNQRRAA